MGNSQKAELEKRVKRKAALMIEKMKEGMLSLVEKEVKPSEDISVDEIQGMSNKLRARLLSIVKQRASEASK